MARQAVYARSSPWGWFATAKRQKGRCLTCDNDHWAVPPGADEERLRCDHIADPPFCDFPHTTHALLVEAAHIGRAAAIVVVALGQNVIRSRSIVRKGVGPVRHRNDEGRVGERDHAADILAARVGGTEQRHAKEYACHAGASKLTNYSVRCPHDDARISVGVEPL
jgi:hypothetical protein